MTNHGENEGWQDYSTLGLVANPFRTQRSRDGEPVAVSMEIQAAANSLIAALVDADGKNARSIWVEKSTAIPDFYHLAAIAQAEKRLITDDDLGYVHTYLQLYMLKLGRIRSALQFLTERVAMRQFDRTLAVWVEEILADPDDSLEAYAPASEFLEEFASEFADDPLEALAGVFGEPVVERDIPSLQTADIRLSSQEPDVEETDDSPEADGQEGLPPHAEEDEASGREAVIIDYIVEYTRVHLSPVIGRGIRVYGLRGTAAIANEVTLTKAPRKTFKAVCTFACKRFDGVALIYDGFALWRQVPEDIQERFVTAMSELRVAMKGNGTIIFLAAPGEVPEIEAEHRTDHGTLWDFPGLSAIEKDPEAFDVEMVSRWVAAAAIGDADGSAIMELLSPLADSAATLPEFVNMAAQAVDDAAGRGLATIDEEALRAGKGAAAS